MKQNKSGLFNIRNITAGQCFYESVPLSEFQCSTQKEKIYEYSYLGIMGL